MMLSSVVMIITLWPEIRLRCMILLSGKVSSCLVLVVLAVILVVPVLLSVVCCCLCSSCLTVVVLVMAIMSTCVLGLALLVDLMCSLEMLNSWRSGPCCRVTPRTWMKGIRCLAWLKTFLCMTSLAVLT